MKREQKEIKRYIKQVHSKLPYTGKEKHRIMEDLKGNIENFLKDHPEAELADVETHFGSPESIAYSCVEQTELDELIRKMRIRRVVVRIVAATAAVAVLLWAGAVGWAIFQEWNSTHGYNEDTIEEEWAIEEMEGEK